MAAIKRKPVTLSIDEKLWAEACAVARAGHWRKFSIFCEIAVQEKLDREKKATK
jgi:hypothetical protein